LTGSVEPTLDVSDLSVPTRRSPVVCRRRRLADDHGGALGAVADELPLQRGEHVHVGGGPEGSIASGGEGPEHAVLEELDVLLAGRELEILGELAVGVIEREVRPVGARAVEARLLAPELVGVEPEHPLCFRRLLGHDLSALFGEGAREVAGPEPVRIEPATDGGLVDGLTHPSHGFHVVGDLGHGVPELVSPTQSSVQVSEPGTIADHLHRLSDDTVSLVLADGLEGGPLGAAHAPEGVVDLVGGLAPTTNTGTVEDPLGVLTELTGDVDARTQCVQGAARCGDCSGSGALETAPRSLRCGPEALWDARTHSGGLNDPLDVYALLAEIGAKCPFS